MTGIRRMGLKMEMGIRLGLEMGARHGIGRCVIGIDLKLDGGD